MTTTIFADGLERLATYVAVAPKIARQAARIAINDVAERRGVKAARELMRGQVAFPDEYLTGNRFGVTRKATESTLEAAITGRFRPTSLARFATSRIIPAGRQKGVQVRVKPGSPEVMKRAFLLRLRAGSRPATADNANLGLAIRLRPGEKIENKKIVAKQISGGLYLLYGPSVDQVFRTVAADVAPDVAEEVDIQFTRQFNRLSRGLI